MSVYYSDMLEKQEPKRLTVTEAATELGVSRQRVYALIKLGTLEPWHDNGRTFLLADEVERYKLEREEVGDELRGDGPGGLLREATGAVQVSLSANLRLFQVYGGLLADARARIRELEAERRELVVKTDELIGKQHDRELERIVVQQTLTVRSDRREILERTLGPIVPVLMNRLLGVRRALPDDPVGRQLRGLLESLTDEQGARIMEILSDAQRAALISLMELVEGRPGASPEKSAA